MKDFRISNNPGSRHTDAVASLLTQPRLWVPKGDYPAHTEWRDKAVAQVGVGDKLAMVAWWGDDEAAVGVYQLDPSDPTRIELRNLSVEPTARGRGLAPFVLRQIECEAAIEFPGATTLVADVKHTNAAMIGFALRSGFRIVGVTELQGSFAHNGVEDVLLVKPLTPTE